MKFEIGDLLVPKNPSEKDMLLIVDKKEVSKTYIVIMLGNHHTAKLPFGYSEGFINDYFKRN